MAKGFSSHVPGHRFDGGKTFDLGTLGGAGTFRGHEQATTSCRSFGHNASSLRDVTRLLQSTLRRADAVLFRIFPSTLPTGWAELFSVAQIRNLINQIVTSLGGHRLPSRGRAKASAPPSRLANVVDIERDRRWQSVAVCAKLNLDEGAIGWRNVLHRERRKAGGAVFLEVGERILRANGGRGRVRLKIQDRNGHLRAQCGRATRIWVPGPREAQVRGRSQ